MLSVQNHDRTPPIEISRGVRGSRPSCPPPPVDRSIVRYGWSRQFNKCLDPWTMDLEHESIEKRPSSAIPTTPRVKEDQPKIEIETRDNPPIPTYT